MCGKSGFQSRQHYVNVICYWDLSYITEQIWGINTYIVKYILVFQGKHQWKGRSGSLSLVLACENWSTSGIRWANWCLADSLKLSLVFTARKLATRTIRVVSFHFSFRWSSWAACCWIMICMLRHCSKIPCNKIPPQVRRFIYYAICSSHFVKGMVSAGWFFCSTQLSKGHRHSEAFGMRRIVLKLAFAAGSKMQTQLGCP